MLQTKISLKGYNFKLIIFVLIALFIGALMVNSANSSYTEKNIIGIFMAIIIMILVSFIDYRKYLNYYWILYIINIVLLVSTKIPHIGYSSTGGGATRWIKLFGFVFQPSELSKLILIIFVAAYIYKRQDNFNTFTNIIQLIVLLLIPLGLVVTQPDLSTTIVTFMILFVIVFVGGLSIKLIIYVSSIMVPISVALLWYIQQPWQILLKPWQQRRVLSFISPSKYISTESYQQINATLAIGSGRFYGNGLNNTLPSSVKNGHYIPEPQTDFIFSIVGEDLGFIGSILVILVIFIIMYLLFNIAKRSNDVFGKLIAVGVASYIGLQTFINIGVVTMVLPNTGLPLPFISYGLTSLFVSCIMIGVCLNISKQSNTKYYRR